MSEPHEDDTDKVLDLKESSIQAELEKLASTKQGTVSRREKQRHDGAALASGSRIQPHLG